MSSCQLMFPGVRSSLESGFGLKPPTSSYRSYFSVVSKLLLLYSTIDKTSQGFNLLPVASKVVPSVIASSVCWSLQCLISALTQRGRWWTLFFFFFLGSLVQSCCGERGTLQTNNTGVCSQCLSHTGPAPTHGACGLPAHTAQALGCSARNCLRLALGYMHLPGLSRSVSGTPVVLRGADLVGPAYCAIPRSEQLR